MGTRADFYVGRGLEAQWIGSICWDGYPKGIDLTGEKEQYGNKHYSFPKGEHLFEAKTVEEFKERVAKFFSGRDDVTLPQDGWPWPWETSHTTDFAYAFDKGKVWASCFGHKWFRPKPGKEAPDSEGKSAIFPNMKDVQKVTFGKRSGLLIFTS